jgi:hypothetical protein
MKSMMNAADTHAEAPSWVPRDRCHAPSVTARRAIGDETLIIRTIQRTK